MKKIELAFKTALLFALAGASFGIHALECPKQGDKKEVICHVPPGNPDARHIIAVGKNAVKAHLDHGDSKGICPDTQYEDMKSLCGICDVDMEPSC